MNYGLKGGTIGGGGGQSLSDRLQAAKHTLAGSAVGRAVCKSTTEELIPPKRKHVNYLLLATNQSNVSVPQIVELLLERLQTSNWIVTFKALLTIHQIMNSGNERFEACIASYSQRFQLGQFFDRSSLVGFEMSSHIRKYASYLDGKREAYRINGFDFCRIKRGYAHLARLPDSYMFSRDDGSLRKMSFEKLAKIIPVLQSQIETITSFTLTSVEIMNNIVCAACYLMFKDVIKLYACYNDAITAILEYFFDLKKVQCKEALNLYCGFLKISDDVANFLKSAENFGTQKSEIPDLKKAPESLLSALQAHCASLDQLTSVTPDTQKLGSMSVMDIGSKPIAGIDVNDQIKAIEDEANAMSRFEHEHHQKQKESSVSITDQAPKNHQEDLLDLEFEISSPALSADKIMANEPRPKIEDLFSQLNMNQQLNQPTKSLQAQLTSPRQTFIRPKQSYNPFLDQSICDNHDNLRSKDSSTNNGIETTTQSQRPCTNFSCSLNTNPFMPTVDQNELSPFHDLDACVRSAASQISNWNLPRSFSATPNANKPNRW